MAPGTCLLLRLPVKRQVFVPRGYRPAVLGSSYGCGFPSLGGPGSAIQISVNARWFGLMSRSSVQGLCRLTALWSGQVGRGPSAYARHRPAKTAGDEKELRNMLLKHAGARTV